MHVKSSYVNICQMPVVVKILMKINRQKNSTMRLLNLKTVVAKEETHVRVRPYLLASLCTIDFLNVSRVYRQPHFTCIAGYVTAIDIRASTVEERFITDLYFIGVSLVQTQDIEPKSDVNRLKVVWCILPTRKGVYQLRLFIIVSCDRNIYTRTSREKKRMSRRVGKTCVVGDNRGRGKPICTTKGEML